MPLEDAFERRDADKGPLLRVASIGAVTRHMAVLLQGVASAQGAARIAAQKDLVRTGSRMFADYVRRQSCTNPADAWLAKGPRGSERSRHDRATRGPMLEEVRGVANALNERQLRIVGAAERRCGIVLFDVRTAMESLFNEHPYSAHRAGVLVGCMLEGAALAIDDSEPEDQDPVLGAAMALCNAIERTYAGESEAPGFLRRWALSFTRPNFWRRVLDREPLAVVRRCADAVVKDPAVEQTRGGKAAFAAGVREACASFKVADGADCLSHDDRVIQDLGMWGLEAVAVLL